MPDTAYVFIYLPGEVHTTVAGRFDLDNTVSPAVGQFVYGQSYLSNPAAVPLDPIALPLREQLFRTTLMSGFFGVMRDAIPDDWGRHVATKLYGSKFQVLFDYLWLPTADRMGALAFGPTSLSAVEEKPLLHWVTVQNTVYLDALEKIDRDAPLTSAEREVALLFGGGTTAGGARPKFTTIKDNAIWLAKLNRQSDRFNEVRVETAMLDLATACGIDVPEHDMQHVHGQDILLVKRFDRALTAAGVVRHRMVSAATVFQADEAVAQYSFTGSYLRFSRELARWTVTGDRDRRQLFRRIAFNALTSATDDHERNHALVADEAQYRLSPAFDLVPKPSNTQRRLLALVIGEYGAVATRENLLSRADVFQLSDQAANDIINEVQQIVRTQWRERMVARDVGAEDIAKIAGCFAPAWFESQSPPPGTSISR